MKFILKRFYIIIEMIDNLIFLIEKWCFLL